MKSPRDILLGRHRVAEPKLDEIRETVVAAVRDQRGRESAAIADRRYSWREFIHSLRWHFATMSALWLLALFLNAAHSPDLAANIAVSDVPARQKVFASFQENRRLLMQLIESPVVEPALPPRRSQLQFTTAIA